MTRLQANALARLPLAVEQVEKIYALVSREHTHLNFLRALCESHERLRAELKGTGSQARGETTGGRNVNRLDWLKKRQAGISASDAADLIGCGYNSALQLYRKKVEPVTEDDANPRAGWRAT